jgi:hypothetical protein
MGRRFDFIDRRVEGLDEAVSFGSGAKKLSEHFSVTDSLFGNFLIQA